MGRGGGGRKKPTRTSTTLRGGHHRASYLPTLRLGNSRGGRGNRKKSTIVRRSHSQLPPGIESTKSSAGRGSPGSNAGPALGAKSRKSSEVPFRTEDHVLLVGEGDFSFALSLAEHHQVKRITATCYDSEAVLYEKYPQARSILHRFLVAPSSATTSPSASPSADQSDSESETSWRGFSPSLPSDKRPETIPKIPNRDATTADVARNIFFSVSATALSHPAPKGHAKLLRAYAPFTKIVFNFPHVGGLSTDVNRQVRANQELLVGFFKSAIPLLASEERPVMQEKTTMRLMRNRFRLNDVDEDGRGSAYNTADKEDCQEDLGTNPTQKCLGRASTTIEQQRNGQILVSVFEGEPYTLWSIRDLARHCGLVVVTSFRFLWEQYPGYRHARTLGEVQRMSRSSRNVAATCEDENEEEDGPDSDSNYQEDEGAAAAASKHRAQSSKTTTTPPAPSTPGTTRKRPKKPAWRGEERQARCFVLEVREDAQQQHSNQNASADSVDVVVSTGGNNEPQGQLRKRKRRKGDGSDTDSDSD